MTRPNPLRPAALAAGLAVALALSPGAAAQAPGGRASDRASDRPTYLAQSWSDLDRAWFYGVSQGSQIMPYAWFMSLEVPEGGALFVADRLARFGYLPNPYDGVGRPRTGLPIGFVKDADDRGEWIGMTCSACHVNRVELRGRQVQIDGGPTDADMFAFIEELGRAASLTASEDARFDRFARRVLPAALADRDAAGFAADARRLRAGLAEFARRFDRYVETSRAKVPWGPARLDAFGMIFNRATGIDLRDEENIAEPNAPVSYPFLWDTSWHDWVQWNGSAPNRLAVGRLGRNVGEVLGVFARAEVPDALLPLWLNTSVNRPNLLSIENRLRRLTAPAWPDSLAPRTAAQRQAAAAGKVLYDTYCLRCHAIARTGADRHQEVKLIPLAAIGTDPVMATNAATRTARTGILEGVRIPFLLSTPPLPERMRSLDLVASMVAGAIIAPIDHRPTPTDLGRDQAALVSALLERGAAARAARNELMNDVSHVGGKGIVEEFLNARKERDLLVYKARPLDGVWATGPFLHNGSVPSLYELLLPADQRSRTFRVGSREIDERNIGFRTDAGPFLFDTTLPGNSNQGHDGPGYGTDRLTEEQRRQLLEYLRTL